MADWYGQWRTNAFKVKDEDAFKNFINKWPEVHCEEREHTFVLFASDKSDKGALPVKYDISTIDDDPIELTTAIKKYLAEDSYVIFMESGAEKIAYLTGYAIAVHPRRKPIIVDIWSIHNLVAQKWGIEIVKECMY